MSTRVRAERSVIRFKRQLRRVLAERVPASAPELSLLDRMRLDLQRRGVAENVSDLLARRLEARLADDSPEAYESALDAAATACGTESRSHEELGRTLEELGEVERMMKNFTDELGKLDETLEVLAAYLRRMRTQTGQSAERRILH